MMGQLAYWVEDQTSPFARAALILDGPIGTPCAYVGVPLDHPLAVKSYSDVPLEVHGGLTFSNGGTATGDWPEGWWWYGWDYSHAGDYMSFAPSLGGHRWTLEEIEGEVRDAMEQLGKLMAEYVPKPVQLVLEEVEAEPRPAPARCGRPHAWRGEMAKAVETAIFGATIRQIVDAGDGAHCAQFECVADATWAVWQEHYDSQDDGEWFSCDTHLADLAVEAIEFDEDAELRKQYTEAHAANVQSAMASMKTLRELGELREFIDQHEAHDREIVTERDMARDQIAAARKALSALTFAIDHERWTVVIEAQENARAILAAGSPDASAPVEATPEPQHSPQEIQDITSGNLTVPRSTFERAISQCTHPIRTKGIPAICGVCGVKICTLQAACNQPAGHAGHCTGCEGDHKYHNCDGSAWEDV